MVRAVVAYDGTDFCGFQRQSALPTIGGALESAFENVFGQVAPVAAAGRTDAGVHASGQVISFPAPARFPIDRLVLALREHLIASISLHDPTYVSDGWSARFKARERRYVYLLHTSRERDALRNRYYGTEHRSINVGLMQKAALELLGKRDFRSFCGTPPNNGTIRTLRSITVARLDARTVRFELCADGFLHHMVRIAVGTLLDIGMGFRAADALPAILAACDRRAAGPTFSASGLYLAGVVYPDFDSFREP